MFMEREELKYGIKLGKTQLRFNGKLLLSGPFFFMLFQILINFGNIVLDTWILKAIAGDVHFQVMDFTTGVGFSIFFLVVVFAIWNDLYGANRKQQELYPQTNKSRFIANIIPEYVFIVGVSMSSIILNGILFLVLPLIERYSENTVLVGELLPIEIGIAGLMVLAYGLLIQSAFRFLESLIRKYKIWLITVPMIMGVYLMNDMDTFWETVFKVGGFYFNESSLGIFLLKVIVTHLVLNIFSYVLEVNTEFSKRIEIHKKGTLIAALVALVLVTLLVSIGNITVTVMEPEVELEEVDDEWLEDDIWNTEEESVEVDIRHLEEGSVIEVIIEDIELPYIDSSDSYETEIIDTLRVTYMGGEEEVVVSGDTLVLTYSDGVYIEDGLNIYPYLEPEFTYELEGNTLTIGYELKNPDVHILYVDKGMVGKFSSKVTDNVTGSGVWGSSQATLMIDVK